MEETKKCPYCGEEILAIAKKCKHCGEWLDKEVKKEQIPCPICGELINHDMETCPYCDEPTHFLYGQSIKTKPNLKENVSMDTDDDFCLYCKSCKAKLSVDAQSCNSCGDQDPFFIKKIENYEMASLKIGSYSALGLIILAAILFYNCISTWVLIVGGLIFFFILSLVLSFISYKVLYRTSFSECENIMRQFYTKIGHPKAFDIWKKRVEEISSFMSSNSRP